MKGGERAENGRQITFLESESVQLALLICAALGVLLARCRVYARTLETGNYVCEGKESETESREGEERIEEEEGRKEEKTLRKVTTDALK